MEKKKCLMCKKKKILVERSDYCHECYEVLRKRVHDAVDRVKAKEEEQAKEAEQQKEQKEQQKKIGRPVIGVTRKVSLTLPSDLWKSLEEIQDQNGISLSEAVRTVLSASFERSPAAP